MKAIINKKRYDTETAEEITSEEANCGRGDFSWWAEALYRTKKGSWFLAGKGGPNSNYAVTEFGTTSGGEDIKPLSRDEVVGWLIINKKYDVLDKYFGDQIEDA